MGGYSFDLILDTHDRELVAGSIFLSWFDEQLARLAKTQPIFIREIRYYLRVMDLRKKRGDPLPSFGLKDCAGTADAAMLATAHLMSKLVASSWRELNERLRAANLRMLPRKTRDPYIEKHRFTLFRGGIAMLEWDEPTHPSERHQKDLAKLYVDADNPRRRDQPSHLDIDYLPKAEQVALLKFWKASRCECPACARRPTARRKAPARRRRSSPR